MRVRWFPLAEDLGGNPYWSELRSSLEALGVEFDCSPAATGIGRRWLVSNRRQVHVLHIHFVQPFYAYKGTQAKFRWVLRLARNLLLARGLGYKTVLTLHDLKPSYPLSPSWVDYLGHWAAVNLTSDVIVHYRSAAACMSQRYGRKHNVHVMPHPSFVGVYPNSVSRAEARRKLGYGDAEMLMVFFGGIRPNKGVEDLLTAFSRLDSARMRLLIAGKPWPPKEYLDRLLKMAAADSRVRFTAEYIADNQVQLYLNSADVVVLPFREILTSSSAHLAMTFGRAVIAPAMGSLVDAITSEVGILYDPTSSGGLHSALLQCQSENLDAMGRRAYERANQFRFADLAMETLRVYRSA